jgi:lysyl-tRNA synthetase class 2
VTGGYKIMYQPKPGADEVEIDFTPPYKRIPMIEGLEEVMKIKLPDLEDPELDSKLKAICDDFEVECSAPHTAARLLDALVGDFLEANITNPTFITEHPQFMSPLAKHHRSKKGLTERFELFVAQREVSVSSCCFVLFPSCNSTTYLTILCHFMLALQCLYGVEQSSDAI